MRIKNIWTKHFKKCLKYFRKIMIFFSILNWNDLVKNIVKKNVKISCFIYIFFFVLDFNIFLKLDCERRIKNHNFISFWHEKIIYFICHKKIMKWHLKKQSRFYRKKLCKIFYIPFSSSHSSNVVTFFFKKKNQSRNPYF